MTFEKFQATKTYCDNVVNECSGYPCYGYVYDGRWIIEDADTWPEGFDRFQPGRWYLITDRDEMLSDDLELLERYLFDWLRKEDLV